MVDTSIDTHRIYNWIADIPDPEIPVISIADLGMLRKVEYKDEKYVVTITPTYTACPAMKMIEDEISEILHGKKIDNFKIDLVYTPAWTTDWINENAKEKLRKYGISPPKHSSCSRTNTWKQNIRCPRCDSKETEVISKFGSTACKSLCNCNSCKETFEYFKCH